MTSSDAQTAMTYEQDSTQAAAQGSGPMLDVPGACAYTYILHVYICR